MVKKLISKSEFARRAGVSAAAVTKASATILKYSVYGKRIDMNHSAAIKYINRHVDVKTEIDPVVKGWNAVNAAKKLEALEALKSESFEDMTLREVIRQFGTDTAFSDWLRAVKLIEDINEKRLKNTQTRRELVSLQLVKNHLIDPFYAEFNKLLSDGSKTIARRVASMSSAGRSVAECEEFVADHISSYIKRMKSEALRKLKSA